MRTGMLTLAATLFAGVLFLAGETAVLAANGSVQLGPRPFYLVDRMEEGPLKSSLQQCAGGPFKPSDFSIGHRGAALQFPEHTKESYEAAARMGAGIIECDVTFTRDRALVCRHSQCDLHTTTNVLAIPDLAAKCSRPFTPADPSRGRKATAKCCASDFTLAEFKQLRGKMDAGNSDATSVEAYMDATLNWRTDLYAASGTLLTHAESIALIKALDAKFTPELKAPAVPMPFQGDYARADYARQLIDDYEAAGVDPGDVFVQSFDLDDVLFWIREAPPFGRQAVYLDDRYKYRSFDPMRSATWNPGMAELASQGVKIIAPPLWVLVTVDDKGRVVPSAYATAARDAGLDIITWTLERSGPLNTGGGWYYQSIKSVTDDDGDAMNLLHVLAQDVGVIGVFSDWPATVTYYANCMGLD